MGHVKSGDESGHFCIPASEISKKILCSPFTELGFCKKSDGATLTQIWQFCQNWTKWSWWWRSPLLESKFFQTPHVVVSTLTFSIWIYLPFDVCSLHIVDIVMFGSARWPSSHYWGLLLLHCVEVFYTRGSSSFFPSIIFFFARRERFAGSIVAITILS